MKKQRLVSGIRATANPHIGNYLGAIRDHIALQNEDKYERFYFVADLHSLTTPFEPKEIRKITMEVVADYLALGLDPKKSTLFLQSQIAEHSELAWIFNCITPLGELYRMTQFKEKSEQHKESINSGLLNYPVLMAADILLYKGEVVPVGEDQLQHIELTRVIAKKFNSKLGKTFPEPKPYMQKALRIKSLMDPEKKMSKTGDEALMIDDSPEEIKRKIKKAVTATVTPIASDSIKVTEYLKMEVSGGKAYSPGVDNLFFLLREFGTKEQIKNFENARDDGSLRFSDLKETLAEQIAEHFKPFRAKKKELLKDPSYIAQVLAEGAEKARMIAKETMKEVKQKTGLL